MGVRGIRVGLSDVDRTRQHSDTARRVGTRCAGYGAIYRGPVQPPAIAAGRANRNAREEQQRGDATRERVPGSGYPEGEPRIDLFGRAGGSAGVDSSYWRSACFSVLIKRK